MHIYIYTYIHIHILYIHVLYIHILYTHILYIHILNTTATLNKLDLFWKKAPVSTTWKLRVRDAVITSKLSYGLESESLTNAEYERLDSFQIKALRKTLGIKHSYHSHVSNEVVMQRANQIISLREGKTISKMSGKNNKQANKVYGTSSESRGGRSY